MRGPVAGGKAMIDEALFEQAYQAFISANDGGERHRLKAALAVIEPRLKAAEGMRKAMEHAHKSRNKPRHDLLYASSDLSRLDFTRQKAVFLMDFLRLKWLDVLHRVVILR